MPIVSRQEKSTPSIRKSFSSVGKKNGQVIMAL